MASKLTTTSHIHLELFEVPLEYLKNDIFQELFRMAEEEFGFISNGHMRLPRDAIFIDQAISLLQRNVAKDVQQTLQLTLSPYHRPQHPRIKSFTCK